MSESTMTATMPTAPNYEYEFHPLAEIFPLIESDEYDGLVSDIRRNGLHEPITLYQGKILDGRNRYRAAKEAGHKFTDRDFTTLPVGVDPKAFVISTNVQRRHLNTKQKREFIARLLQEMSTSSDRQIAKLAGVDNKTVASVREELRRRAKDFADQWRRFGERERRGFVEAFRADLQKLLHS
jgi:ParB-like chromosome segregation protein Spo0J